MRKLIIVLLLTIISLPVMAEQKEAPKPESRAVPVSAVAAVDDSKNGKAIPFGTNIFSSQFDSGSKEPQNPDYKIVPGDQIDIQVWGAVDFNTTSIVDNQGNIFLPDVGPVNVQGVSQEQLNSVISQRVGEVYKENVEVYTNLRGSLPVSVFVTGAVKAPGRYVGTSTDSVIDYVFKAGGIDPIRGSYRSVKIVRDNVPVEEFDIYEFLINGTFPKFQIKESDTILVTERGKIITAEGQVKNPFVFEFKHQATIGSELVKYASPLPEATNVLIVGTRNGVPYKSYVSSDKFAETVLEDGDKVFFSAGTHEEKIEISVLGRHKGPKKMVVPLDARLVEVLNNIPIDKNLSDSKAVFIRRDSVAAKQKQAIEDSLRRLEETLLLARASGITSSETQSISDAEVTLLEGFVLRAKSIEPEGRVVVSNEDGISNITLEEGDEIVIPQRTDLVMVNGEVLMPKAIVWRSGDDVTDYIEKAGGFSDRANESNIIVIKANGETAIGTGAEVMPGDEIMILPEVKINNLEITSKVVDIIYKIAVAAVIPFRL